MNREIQQRLKWVSLYEESRDAGFVCRRCGISRPTLRNWWLHYQLNGIEGLRSRRRLLHPPNTKVSDHYEKLILGLRTQHNLGARRIQSELLRQHTLSLGLATIHNPDSVASFKMDCLTAQPPSEISDSLRKFVEFLYTGLPLQLKPL